MRKKKMYYNTLASLINQIITIICGFILPRLLLSTYGSTINGLVSSITQFLSFIAFLELGVGAVVQSTLYKPLVNNDYNEISKIIKSSQRFFKRIALLFLLYTVLMSLIYPLFILEKFNYLYTFSLIFIISISSFAQYYFGISYQLLLNADQKSYVQIGIQIGAIVLNTVVCVILMNLGFSIQIVKLSASLIFVLRPVIMMWYVKRNYKIDKNINLEIEPIEQKWNGLAQHLAFVVLNNTDIMVLTTFSTLENVSIYSVYFLVVSGVKQIISSVTTGMNSLLGSMIANNEQTLMKETFNKLELTIHFIVVWIFTCTSILIVPFITVYTSGINDVNYIVPSFAILITMAQASYCIRLPYNIIVLSAGHFKQTQNSAIIEMGINIIVSILLVLQFGLVGVAIGTLVAMTYRTIYFVFYLQYNILKRSAVYFFKYMLVNFIVVSICIFITNGLNTISTTYIAWIGLAFKVAIICFIVTFIIYLTAFNKNIRYIYMLKNIKEVK